MMAPATPLAARIVSAISVSRRIARLINKPSYLPLLRERGRKVRLRSPLSPSPPSISTLQQEGEQRIPDVAYFLPLLIDASGLSGLPRNPLPGSSGAKAL